MALFTTLIARNICPARCQLTPSNIITSTSSPTGSQGSGVLRSMAEANGLMVLHHAQGNVAIGDEVDVMMFEGVS